MTVQHCEQRRLGYGELRDGGRMPKVEYVLITPARNEADHIEKTIKSVIAQTTLPKRWVIVSDGSTDATDDIVRKYQQDRPWIELVRLPERSERHFAAKVEAFNAGYARVRDLDFQVVGNVDGDVSFDADYFEYLLRKFGEVPELGVAGTHYVEGAFHSFHDSYISVHHVNGQVQLFRRACFEAIGGYVPNKAGGIDWVAVTTARMKGWRTYSYSGRVFHHHRAMGTAGTSVLGARFHYGKKDYFMGGHPLWQLLRGAFQLTKRPYVVGGLALVGGYFYCWARGMQRSVSPELMRFHRREQLQRIWGILRMRPETRSGAADTGKVGSSAGHGLGGLDMSSDPTDQQARHLIFKKETLVNGQPASIDCVDVDGCTVSLEGRLLRIARVEDEWYADLPNVERAISKLSAMRSGRPDILTFWQRLPVVEPRFNYHREYDDLAVLPVTSYDHWWHSQINAKTRNRIRKAQKAGLEIRQVDFDEEFVGGMTEIFNESPVRQGKTFWHYGKDRATVHRQFSRYLSREVLIGAYVGQELAGFVMLGLADSYALLGQIIGSLMHRDKSPTNALIAKAVEICAERKIPHLVYYFWSEDSLADFKRHCGFERVSVPRYFIPLTFTGRIAVGLGVHRGWKAMIPAKMRERLKSIRRQWRERSAT